MRLKLLNILLGHHGLLIGTLLFLSCSSISAQISNSKEDLINNNVASELILTGDESCGVAKNIYNEFGNTIQWDFSLSPIIYKSVYNDQQEQIWTLILYRDDPTRIDSIPLESGEYDLESEYKIKKDAQGRIVSKYNEEEVMYFTFDRSGALIEEVRFLKDEMVFKETFVYENNLLVTKTTMDLYNLNAINSIRNSEEEITELVETYSYDEKGRVNKLGVYILNKCLNVDAQVIFEIEYHENGLLKSSNVLDEDELLLYQILFEYEYRD